MPTRTPSASRACGQGLSCARAAAKAEEAPRGGSLNVASWYVRGPAALQRARALCLGWLLLQEVRLDPRQAKGVRTRLGSGGRGAAI
eukprot:15468956-Alexandrium_andersonii.AAC.1